MIDLSKLDAAQAALVNVADKSKVMGLWTPDLVIILTICVLLFGILVLGLSTYLLRKSNSDDVVILKVVGLLTITILAATLMIVGYDSDQLTPIIGLFGAIVGYLLGKDKPTPPGS